MRRLGPDHAEDVVAEAFTRAFETRHRYEFGRAEALPWLYGIITNVIGLHRRAEVRGPGDRPGVVKEPSGTFWLGPAGSGAEVSMEDLEALPTDPEALRQKVTSMQQGDPADEPDVAVLPLTSLIAELPAPAEVRSAAFRALAELPGVRRLGAVGGGEELLIQSGRHERRLVVDPETSQVILTNYLPTATGGSMGTNRFIKLTTGWTDDLPR